jgi:hypothetical protein
VFFFDFDFVDFVDFFDFDFDFVDFFDFDFDVISNFFPPRKCLGGGPGGDLARFLCGERTRALALGISGSGGPGGVLGRGFPLAIMYILNILKI